MKEFKVCTSCKKEYPATSEYFHHSKTYKDGLAYCCKVCCKEKQRIDHVKNKDLRNANSRQYLNKNRESINEQRRKHYHETIEFQRQQAKDYYYRHKDERNAYCRKYHQDNKIRLRVYYLDRHNKRLENNLHYRLLHNLRANISSAFSRKYKSGRSVELIGCSIEFLLQHLESQFKDNMSWNNYGKGGWHIDHIKPCKLFDLTNPEEQRKCFHWSNLQPLWEKDNLRKSWKYEEVSNG